MKVTEKVWNSGSPARPARRAPVPPIDDQALQAEIAEAREAAAELAAQRELAAKAESLRDLEREARRRTAIAAARGTFGEAIARIESEIPELVERCTAWRDQYEALADQVGELADEYAAIQTRIARTFQEVETAASMVGEARIADNATMDEMKGAATRSSNAAFAELQRIVPEAGLATFGPLSDDLRRRALDDLIAGRRRAFRSVLQFWKMLHRF